MTQYPPTAVSARSRHEFRRLCNLLRVRVLLGLANVCGLVGGIALAGNGKGLLTRILLTVGVPVFATLASAGAVYLYAIAISPRRILEDRVAALEVKAIEVSAPPGTPVIQQARTVNNFYGSPMPPEIEGDQLSRLEQREERVP